MCSMTINLQVHLLTKLDWLFTGATKICEIYTDDNVSHVACMIYGMWNLVMNYYKNAINHNRPNNVTHWSCMYVYIAVLLNQPLFKKKTCHIPVTSIPIAVTLLL